VPTFDGGTGTQAVFALAHFAVFPPRCAVLALFTDPQSLCSLTFSQPRPIFERLPLFRRHREKLEVSPQPLDETTSFIHV
jgi:hypothetical protein